MGTTPWRAEKSDAQRQVAANLAKARTVGKNRRSARSSGGMNEGTATQVADTPTGVSDHVVSEKNPVRRRAPAGGLPHPTK